MRTFDKIKTSLDEAIDFIQGDPSSCCVHIDSSWLPMPAPMDGSLVDLLFPNGAVLPDARYLVYGGFGWVARRPPDERPDAPPEEWDFVSYPNMQPVRWRPVEGTAHDLLTEDQIDAIYTARNPT